MALHGDRPLGDFLPSSEPPIRKRQQPDGSLLNRFLEVATDVRASRRLQDERPGLEALYISGYPENAVVHDGVVDKKVNFLQKPFAAGALLQRIRKLLDAAAD